MHLLEKVRLPTKVPQYEDEHQHEHIDRRRKAGQMIKTKWSKLKIFLKHKCPFDDLSDAEHMGAEAGLLQHRAEDYHKE